MKTFAIFILSLLLISCSKTNDEVILDKCNESVFIKKLDENTPVIVKTVKDGEPFYNGSKIYYELDAETYLPEVFEQNHVKHIWVFPINKINYDIGSQTMVKGTITSCITADHGLFINMNISFYLLEQ